MTEKPLARLHISLTEEMRAEIEDYRYEERIPSEAEAVRRLILMGLRSWRTPGRPQPHQPTRKPRK